MIVRRGRCARLALVFTLLGLLLPLLPAASLAAAGAATYVVTNALDNVNDANCQPAPGSCTLRQAVNASNANDPGAGNQNTITFALPGGPQAITLASTTLILRQSVAIQGPASQAVTVRSGSANVDAFVVRASVAAAIGHLTIADSHNGISNFGTLTVTDSTVTGNSSAGIDSGTLELANSTVAGNNDGISSLGGTVTVTNSTVTGNSRDGIVALNPMTLANTIVAGNATNVVGPLNPGGTTSRLAPPPPPVSAPSATMAARRRQSRSCPVLPPSTRAPATPPTPTRSPPRPSPSSPISAASPAPSPPAAVATSAPSKWRR